MIANNHESTRVGSLSWDNCLGVVMVRLSQPLLIWGYYIRMSFRLQYRLYQFLPQIGNSTEGDASVPTLLYPTPAPTRPVPLLLDTLGFIPYT